MVHVMSRNHERGTSIPANNQTPMHAIMLLFLFVSSVRVVHFMPFVNENGFLFPIQMGDE